MNARIEAAAGAVHSEIGDWYPLEGVPNLDAHARDLATKALAAADAVMFSDEAFGYAVSAVRGQISDLTIAEAEAIARDVISALREDA